MDYCGSHNESFVREHTVNTQVFITDQSFNYLGTQRTDGLEVQHDFWEF